MWYLDNGASNHMTGDQTKFSKLDEGVTCEVKFGDGSTVCIKGKESVWFMCKTGEEKVFTDVFYIPTLYNNIIHLGQMSEEGNKVVLDGEFLWVYGGDERPLMKVKRLNLCTSKDRSDVEGFPLSIRVPRREKSVLPQYCLTHIRRLHHQLLQIQHEQESKPKISAACERRK